MRCTFEGLQNVKKIIQEVQARKEEIKKLAKGSLFYEKAELSDDLYLATKRIYQGELLLPIKQVFDFRQGKSKGECFGYVAEWAKCILNNQKPFGIDYTLPPPFHPVLFNSNVGKKYPDLNHLAVLTEEISTLQRLENEPTLLKKR